MGPKKGKSLEEKRAALLKIYRDAKQPFNLKEIEKEGHKAGVVQQVIKEVNQGLVDDSLIQNDKIGSGVFFWSFPSKEAQECANEKQKTENALKRTEDNIEILTSLKRKAELTRCAPQRTAKLTRLSQLQEQQLQLQAAVEAGKANDPVEIERITRAADANRDSANRWVDNTYAVKKFLTKKKGLPSREADKYACVSLCICLCISFPHPP